MPVEDSVILIYDNRMPNKKFDVICVGCKEPRKVPLSDWRKRKSDYCGP